MSYPLALRDSLYALFLETHRFPDRAERFQERARLLGRSKFIVDRIRRYRKALAAWEGGPPGDVAKEVELATLLFKHGLYFDAHEYLETAWKRSEGALKLHLQGLIQLSAALHKLELDPKAGEGAKYLVERGFAKLEDL